MKKISIIFLLIMIAFTVNCQDFIISGESYETVSFKPEIYNNISKYSGVYKYGMSEWESYLVINTCESEVIVQIRYSIWVLDSNNRVTGTKFIYQNLSNVRIESGKLISDELKGRFVNVNGEDNRGLALLTEISSIDIIENNEFGFRSGSFDIYYYGDYSFASSRVLTKDELLKYSKAQLRIIRNEIFARYEYDFKSGGEMEKYFEQKSWYNTNYKNVNSFLTSIEKRNIKLIQSLE